MSNIEEGALSAEWGLASRVRGSYTDSFNASIHTADLLQTGEMLYRLKNIDDFQITEFERKMHALGIYWKDETKKTLIDHNLINISNNRVIINNLNIPSLYSLAGDLWAIKHGPLEIEAFNILSEASRQPYFSKNNSANEEMTLQYGKNLGVLFKSSISDAYIGRRYFNTTSNPQKCLDEFIESEVKDDAARILRLIDSERVVTLNEKFLNPLIETKLDIPSDKIVRIIDNLQSWGFLSVDSFIHGEKIFPYAFPADIRTSMDTSIEPTLRIENPTMLILKTLKWGVDFSTIINFQWILDSLIKKGRVGPNHRIATDYQQWVDLGLVYIIHEKRRGFFPGTFEGPTMVAVDKTPFERTALFLKRTPQFNPISKFYEPKKDVQPTNEITTRSLRQIYRRMRV